MGCKYCVVFRQLAPCHVAQNSCGRKQRPEPGHAKQVRRPTSDTTGCAGTAARLPDMLRRHLRSILSKRASCAGVTSCAIKPDNTKMKAKRFTAQAMAADHVPRKEWYPPCAAATRAATSGAALCKWCSRAPRYFRQVVTVPQGASGHIQNLAWPERD